jgi:hypothetical protein
MTTERKSILPIPSLRSEKHTTNANILRNSADHPGTIVEPIAQLYVNGNFFSIINPLYPLCDLSGGSNRYTRSKR